MIAFVLSMPGVGSWNGRWSGEGRIYAKVVSLGRSKDAGAREAAIVDGSPYRYDFGDGWVASVSVHLTDGGTFRAALEAVERYGGVLERPALTRAWKAFGIPRPPSRGWTRSLWPDRIGWTTSIDQAAYGHPCHKETWLYYVGGLGPHAPGEPPELDWRRLGTGHTVADDGGGGRDQRSRTPLAFRDVLIAMAQSVTREAVAT